MAASSRCLQFRRESSRHPDQRVMRATQQRRPFGLQSVVPLPLASALWRWFTERRGDQPTLFKPVERGVDGPGGERPAGATVDGLFDPAAVGVSLELDDGKEEKLLELAEITAHSRTVVNIEWSARVKALGTRPHTGEIRLAGQGLPAVSA